MKMLEDLAEVVRAQQEYDVKAEKGGHDEYERFLALATDFIRNHHATITDMAEWLDAVERDAARMY